jgi:hypothetical protein
MENSRHRRRPIRRRVLEGVRFAAIVSIGAFVVYAMGCSSSSKSNDATTDSGAATGDTGAPRTDSAAPPDTGTSQEGDSSASADAGGTCSNDVPFSVFGLPWVAPSALHQGVCTASEISAYVGSRSTTTGLGTSGNATCDACIQTPSTATAAGPFITETLMGTTTLAEVNYGGCIANYDGDKTSTGCGAQLNANVLCFVGECGMCSDFNSTMPSPTGPTATCRSAIFASGGPCFAESITPTSSCGMELEADGGVDEACNSITTYGEFLTLWCGGPAASDGGTTDAGATDGGDQ